MGMRISSGQASSAQGGAAVWQQRQQQFKALSEALQSNNLDSAKAAYAALTKNAPSGASGNVNSPLAQLGKALQSGDLAAAQQAFAALRSQHRARSEGTSAPRPGSSAPPPSPPTDTAGNLLNVVA